MESGSKPRPRKSLRLVCIAVPDDGPEGRRENRQVQPDGPGVDIFRVQLYSELRPLNRPNFAADAIHLREPGDARLDAVPPSVAAHGVLIIAVSDFHMRRVRARA